jgi:cytochrome d ubiquinol oxidase subunit I
VTGGIKIPGLDSFLVGFSTDAKVKGWNTVAPKDRPPSPTLLHLAFNAMVAIGSGLLLLGAWLAFSWWRRRDLPRTVWFLRAGAVAGVGAVVALECGWIVTEVGRQPWTVYKLLRTENAVTGATGIWASLVVVLVLYTALGAGTVIALRTMARRWREGEAEDDEVPYGPPAGASP